MSQSTPQPLSPEKEALGRAVIAEFEARQELRKRERRYGNWKLALLIGYGLLLVGAWVYIRVTGIPITTYDIVGLLIVFAATGASAQCATHQELRKLRAEIDELREALKEKSSR